MKWNFLKLFIKCILGIIAFLLFLPVMFFMRWFLFGIDYEIKLPQGYSLVRVYAGAVVMHDDKNHHEIISPNIDGYKVFENIIVGHVSREEHINPEEAAFCKPGYFIVDISNGSVQQEFDLQNYVYNNGTYHYQNPRVQQGLSEKQWMDSLRKYGITEKPRLHKPSRYDGIF